MRNTMDAQTPGWTNNCIRPNPITTKARKGSVGIISPNNSSLIGNKLVFSGSQLTAFALAEQHTATKE